MGFLKRKFNEELLAEIEDKNVNIAGSSFTPFSILKDMDPDGYDNAFSEWCNQRKEEFL